MNYIEAKELSQHIITSIKLSLHFNKYEVDNESDLSGLKYVIERNKNDIKISTAKIKIREPGTFLFLLRKMKDTSKSTDLFIIYSELNKKDDEELSAKLKEFAFRYKTFVVQLKKSGE
ncbi:TPA: hypothetical protein ACMEXA_005646 [Klebsiella variicola subsp. variicola]|jgi:hypothetical protein|uniref:hypothetical protein n=1 Tax=Klebsiella variicola TaxID=244366 RepID=UPI001CCA311F|nr:hypothetical protein [Klebsiella variicola]HBQ8857502.1 hypothetical protein [Klebsiella variicola subsp. variicola]HBQ8869343.1 hypothetical protein [Klebsiella pneumoniae]MEC5999696.1 hypothetical protein [Klebsiella variicola]UBN00572.1 hypothetical protein LB484_29355 [Klebsiella variicola]HBQ8863810.1 hypothetical protein [Klebsiella variicola subsp. variicola]